MTYRVYYVHPYAGALPAETHVAAVKWEIGAPHHVYDSQARRGLGAALRAAGILYAGQSVREARPEGSDLIVFPSRVGGGMHSIRLTPIYGGAS